jgi:hypothetical protein
VLAHRHREGDDVSLRADDVLALARPGEVFGGEVVAGAGAKTVHSDRVLAEHPLEHEQRLLVPGLKGGTDACSLDHLDCRAGACALKLVDRLAGDDRGPELAEVDVRHRGLLLHRALGLLEETGLRSEDVGRGSQVLGLAARVQRDDAACALVDLLGSLRWVGQNQQRKDVLVDRLHHQRVEDVVRLVQVDHLLDGAVVPGLVGDLDERDLVEEVEAEVVLDAV